MKCTLLIAAMLAALLPCLGCQDDFYARQIIKPDVTYGQWAGTFTGDADKLKADKRIDLHSRIAAADGAKMDVWVVNNRAKAPARGTVVLLHGMGDSKASLLALGARLATMGFDVVLPDLRAHGDSEGKYFTWGAKEKNDIKSIIDALVRDKTVSDTVYAFGVSQGGSVAIQYAAVDPRVKGVMALAPNKDITFTRRQLALVAPAMSVDNYNSVLKRAGELGDFDPSDTSAVAAAGKLTCPLLLVHGAMDVQVPVEQSRDIYEAARQPKQLIELVWGSHTMLILGSEMWIANQIDNIARTGLKEPATAPTQQ